MGVSVKSFTVTIVERRSFKVQARDKMLAELAVKEQAVIWDRDGSRVSMVLEVQPREKRRSVTPEEVSARGWRTWARRALSWSGVGTSLVITWMNWGCVGPGFYLQYGLGRTAMGFGGSAVMVLVGAGLVRRLVEAADEVARRRLAFVGAIGALASFLWLSWPGEWPLDCGAVLTQGLRAVVALAGVIFLLLWLLVEYENLFLVGLFGRPWNMDVDAEGDVVFGTQEYLRRDFLRRDMVLDEHGWPQERPGSVRGQDEVDPVLKIRIDEFAEPIFAAVRVLPGGQVALKCSTDGSQVFSSVSEAEVFVRWLGCDPEQYRNEAIFWNRDPEEALTRRYEEWQAQRTRRT
jgi:hypothetical protein